MLLNNIGEGAVSLTGNRSFCFSKHLLPIYCPDIYAHSPAPPPHVPFKIAYSGMPGAYAHVASALLFPGAMRIACASFAEAYHAVEVGTADACVLPLRNNTAGEVTDVTRLLRRGTLTCRTRFMLPIHHRLLILPGADPAKITRVASHPQALAQCASFLQSRGLAPIPYFNTAAAAEWLTETKDPTIAAIASDEAAALYHLTIAEKHISIRQDNRTLFAVLMRRT